MSDAYNFCFPLPPSLESEKVKLVPFVMEKHAAPFIPLHQTHARYFEHVPFGPWTSVNEMRAAIEPRILNDPTAVMFAHDAVDTPGETNAVDTPDETNAVAGCIGYLAASPANLSAELAFVLCLPAFQGKHIASEASRLLMHLALDTPEQGGLGLRRLEWRANSLNVKSIQLAMHLGFRLDAILRWHFVFPEHKAGNGRSIREGDPRPGTKGRDTAVLSLTWDDWENTLLQK
uniref:N-acetyltransferase domain-containing protein n=1 Tax=Schizophyllum commune (strain H4-8 / FGSC 9210) TaxID=578458 RepID=D8QJR9_SCHCM